MKFNQESALDNKEMYIINLDISRIFWFVAIGLLIFVFLFLLGYWVGSDNTIVDHYYMENSASKTNILHKIDYSDQAKVDQKQDSQPVQKSYESQGADQQPAQDSTNTTDQKQKFNEFEQDLSGDSKPNPSEKNNSVSENGILSAPESVMKQDYKSETQTSEKPTASSSYQKPPEIQIPDNHKGNGYTIQIGSHSSSESANKVSNQLKKMKYDAYVQPINLNGKTMYRIRVGNYNTKDQAQKVKEKLIKNANVKDVHNSVIIKTK